MKGGRWDLFNAPPTASWVVKKLCKVKEALSEWMKSPVYSIATVYRELMGTQEKVQWGDATWNRATIPRSRFIIWLAYHDRLKTKQHLFSLGVVEDDKCPICGNATETVAHLFFQCRFSRQCMEMLRHWLGIS